jgi:N-acetylneuraminic acid mutarotase
MTTHSDGRLGSHGFTRRKRRLRHCLSAILCVGILFAIACGGGGGIGTPPPPPPEVNAWTWVSGSSTPNATGIYGTLGVAATSNVPGARYPDATWIDGSGNLWLFGGFGFDSTATNGPLNDLWEFSPMSNKWVWMDGNNTVSGAGIYGTLGIAATANVPGARELGTNWIDANHNFWLFGGQGYDSTGAFGVGLNDLWQFNPSTGQWTWMSGSDTADALGIYGTLGVAAPGNVPGYRFGSVGWVDGSGDLWLFGGGSEAFVNNLWKFDPTSAEWTWEGGSSSGNQSGVYGSEGVTAPANVPGSREEMTAWTDKQGNFWLFGGWGVDITQSNGAGVFNDLWEYSPTANQWTWVSGSNTSGQSGVYGQQGVGAASNVPGARYYGVGWTDASGNLWLFGGVSNSNDSTGTSLVFNDLWEFNIVTKQWTWMSGSDSPNAPGQYGTLGAGAIGNTPGAREGGATWTDSSGNLWLFGGTGLSGPTEYNDLWRWGLTQP